MPGDECTGAERGPLRFQRPSMPSAERIEHYLARSRHARWFSNGGPCWDLLRERIAERAGAHCVPVANATVGLMAALAAVDGARSGREALVPSFTFPATVQAAIWAGFSPRLLDVDLAHWHLAPEQLEHELTVRGDAVGVVVAVSAFGTPPPPAVRQRWEAACRKAGVPLVIDSAAGFGATAADGVAIGAQGDVEVVSFHATKPFAIGEGGAVFTRDAALCERIERIVSFGLGAGREVELAAGLNAKMSELHAAVGLAVLDEYEGLLAARRHAAAELRRAADASVTWQEECERSTWQFAPAAYPSAEARAAAEARFRATVETRSYYLPLHTMPAFRGLPSAEHGLATTEALAARILCLPLAADLTPAEIATIADGLDESGARSALVGQSA